MLFKKAFIAQIFLLLPLSAHAGLKTLTIGQIVVRTLHAQLPWEIGFHQANDIAEQIGRIWVREMAQGQKKCKPEPDSQTEELPQESEDDWWTGFQKAEDDASLLGLIWQESPEIDTYDGVPLEEIVKKAIE